MGILTVTSPPALTRTTGLTPLSLITQLASASR